MKRADQILAILAEADRSLSLSEIANECQSPPANIDGALQTLVKDEYVIREGTRGAMYKATEKGIARTKEEDFGSDRRKPVSAATPSKAPSTELTVGVFTNGELHIEANGKRMVLTCRQAAQLMEFVCAIPNKFLSDAGPDRRPRSGISALVHQMKDD